MINRNHLTKIEKIIYDHINLEVSQTDQSKEEIFLSIKHNLDNHRAFAVEDKSLVLYIRPETKHIAKMDLFVGEDVKVYEWITAGKRILKWIFENTPIKLMYGISANERFINGTKKGGWVLSGKFPKSYWDGEKYIDQYVYYCEKNEFFEFIENKKS